MGTLGAGDIYEKPINTVDFLVRTMINDKLGINFAVKNVLNQEVLKEQHTDEEPVVVNSRRNGIRMGLSLSYTF